MIRSDLDPEYVTSKTLPNGHHLVGWLFTDEKVGISVIKDSAREIRRLRKALEVIASGELTSPELFADEALHAPPAQ